MAGLLNLDSVVNGALFFVGQWSPRLKRNQSRDVLRLVINKLYGASRGSLFHAQIRCSHAALADSLDLSREWMCTLLQRLKKEGWIESFAPRRPGSQRQEVSTFRPGRMLKRLLIMLLKSKQRFQKTRVNDRAQQIPTKQDIEKNKANFAALIAALGEKFSPPSRKRC